MLRALLDDLLGGVAEGELDVGLRGRDHPRRELRDHRQQERARALEAHLAAGDRGVEDVQDGEPRAEPGRDPAGVAQAFPGVRLGVDRRQDRLEALNELAHHEDRDLGAPHYGLGYRPQQGPVQARPAVGAHDDEVDVAPLRPLDDLEVRLPGGGVDLSPALHELAELLQGELAGLGRDDRLAEARSHRAAQPRLDVEDLEPGVRLPGEVQGLQPCDPRALAQVHGHEDSPGREADHAHSLPGRAWGPYARGATLW